MEIVILAAGLGSRLGVSIPKPLTLLADGRTILQQQLENISLIFGSRQKVTLVVGYKSDLIVEAHPTCKFVYNAAYDTTNTSKSLEQALNTLPKNSDVLWLNGDVVFDPQILFLVKDVAERNQSFIVVNTASVLEEEVKYTLRDAKFINSLSKTVPLESALGEAVGINFVAGADKPALSRRLKLVQDQDYFEKAIEDSITYDGLLFEAIDISVRNLHAMEVDFLSDLVLVNQRIVRTISDGGARSNRLSL